MIDMKKKLLLIELNEINFDIVKLYIATDSVRFPSLAKLFNSTHICTTSENKYDEIEPWIQWPSVHTIKKFAEHGIYRLGDIVGNKNTQIFELIEKAGYKVGVVSAMNTENRLKKPAYFIPDPWTQTKTDGSWWSRSIHQAVSQAVNENSQARITFASAVRMTLALLRFGQIRHVELYIKLIINSSKKPWLKALVLDLMLHDIHMSMLNKKRPNFSTLFLNAGAHIQHHFFFNAEPLRGQLTRKNPEWYVGENEDPLADLLYLYDLIVGEYLAKFDAEIIFATGLSQKPYDLIKFYYRLNSHSKFLHNMGIQFTSVSPRMTRDFLVNFENNQEALIAQDKLASIYIKGNGEPLFGEIDNRGKSLFITLTYPQEITSLTQYCIGGYSFPLLTEVCFVAIKNGMHQEKGFAYFTPGVAKYAPAEKSHVASLGKTILNYFGVATT
jgi:hypothetical protein